MDSYIPESGDHLSSFSPSLAQPELPPFCIIRNQPTLGERLLNWGLAILIHALLETARGVANVEEICGASPRMQGLSLGPADLAADRRM